MALGPLPIIWKALDLPEAALDRIAFTGLANLPSAFPVTKLAASSIGAACLAMSELIGTMDEAPRVAVDRRLSSLWFGLSIQPIEWPLPAIWDPLAGDYLARDRWIKLHTNAPHHRAAALKVLDCAAERGAVAEAVKTWGAGELEAAVVDAGGCAAALRLRTEWETHPQGTAVAAEPLIAFSSADVGGLRWSPEPGRPLAGLKVLDLTRVLAGPVATRFLAGYGADVLRVDPPDWDEPGTIPEVTLGKRCARLDLRNDMDRRLFERLLARANVFVHGYRPGALEGLGFGPAERRKLNRDLIEVSLDAYGWTGPWKGRRGFDSLVQFSSGIAEAGMAWKGTDHPVSLPVQALDHATGYLMAAAVIRQIIARQNGEKLASARLSLARTAALLVSLRELASEAHWSEGGIADVAPFIETTPWGEARRYHPPANIVGAPMRWERGAQQLGSSKPAW
ncbi:MAG TPA: CoA transferase [Beijerinckiaceae bacterium]|jgi:hypothetical protein|nr:CoA transferase [Beijerinckiaceae bacterium]